MTDRPDQPAAQPRLRFPRTARITRHNEFQLVMETGRRLANPHLTVWGRRNGRTYTRLGLIVGRRHGGAVRRNHLKRLLREAFRTVRPDLPPGLDIVCTPRKDGEPTLRELQQSFRGLARRLAAQLAPE